MKEKEDLNMILTALRKYVHELAQNEPKEKAKVLGVIQLKNFQDKLYLILDNGTIREFSWDDADEMLPIADLVRLYMNKNVIEIEFKESKDKD
jgi:hypothetical protein